MATFSCKEGVNMKKLFAIILVLVMCVGLFTACTATVERTPESDTSMFIAVETTGSWAVVYHRETKVMYAVSRGGYNSGNFTLLVNADGTPMLWEG
jgi:hypothetical protein